MVQLNLENQNLTRLNDFSLSDLSSLTKLNLQNNMISLINSSNTFFGIPNLIQINLSNNSLFRIKNTWRNLINLKNLILENNPIETIQK